MAQVRLPNVPRPAFRSCGGCEPCRWWQALPLRYVRPDVLPRVPTQSIRVPQAESSRPCTRTRSTIIETSGAWISRAIRGTESKPKSGPAPGADVGEVPAPMLATEKSDTNILAWHCGSITSSYSADSTILEYEVRQLSNSLCISHDTPFL